MAYTPELTATASGILRRIAWAADLPMTQTINTLFLLIPQLFNKETICNACRDKSKCEVCGFGDLQNREAVSCTIEKKRIRLNNPPIGSFHTMAAEPSDSDDDFYQAALGFSLDF